MFISCVYLHRQLRQIKLSTMTARVSHTGKVIVKSTTMIAGRGIQFRGVASNGEFSFIMTEAAYSKISNNCKFN